MFTAQAKELYLSNLNKLKEEVSLFKNETDLWHTQGDVKNSPGNLALHLTGNLNHFIGAQLGNTGYVRNRDREFADKNIPRAEIITGIDEAIEVVNTTLSKLADEDLQKDYPIPFLGKQYSTLEILFILYGHLNYHLGQINYQRRLL
ncbi:MAG: DinB family protein [Bacteroidia bacterium]